VYQQLEHVRRTSASLINADPEEVTFVKNTTEGIGWVANGLNWNTGDNVVSTDIEFPANVYPWMALKSRGVEFRQVTTQSGRVPVELIEEAIDGRTRVISLSAVQFSSGYRSDLESIGQLCRDRGILFCVDAIQALGVLPVDVRRMQIDFLSADGHKWLCGPEGAGLFFCRRELIGHLHPVITGWLGMKNAFDFCDYQFEYVESAQRFDTGSYNCAGLLGLGASIDLFAQIGIEAITSHVLALTDRLVEGLGRKGYQVVSSREPGQASGIVAFTSSVHEHNSLQRKLLDDHRVVIAHREGKLRASPHVYNSFEEIDQLVDLLPEH
jgi:selenocysteine lyase/cysteine desulfurase